VSFISAVGKVVIAVLADRSRRQCQVLPMWLWS